ncbi:hypothetical protein MUN82_12075 [Hymenobacter aerilatus]|uniref:Uncharacterized protein n=1 Tax=Hymenobacter aerilatus TaxID=2932251 RepID=A0A8T9SV78_9BACT|nr:hypothetical protein [Hymenobacter aerilatus]UOR03686.1 hypothetical protein MUN82_12075 [Hymenobacter aerilatus]
MIHLLPNCSPAELLFLLHRPEATARRPRIPQRRKLLRVTFLDLLRQQVLQLKPLLTRPHPRDPASQHLYVMAGIMLPTYVPLPHERIFVQALQRDTTLCIPFRQFVKMVIELLPSPAAYHRQILQNPNTGRFFHHEAWWRRIFSCWTLTSEGKIMRDELQNQINRIDLQLYEAAKNDISQAQHLMREIGGFLFVLPTYASEIGREIDREIQATQLPPDTFANFGGADLSWHDCADSFDSHCGHADADGGHGCDGDSGCSGCGGDGGCSGCGGCGGD